MVQIIHSLEMKSVVYCEVNTQKFVNFTL